MCQSACALSLGCRLPCRLFWRALSSGTPTHRRGSQRRAPACSQTGAAADEHVDTRAPCFRAALSLMIAAVGAPYASTQVSCCVWLTDTLLAACDAIAEHRLSCNRLLETSRQVPPHWNQAAVRLRKMSSASHPALSSHTARYCRRSYLQGMICSSNEWAWPSSLGKPSIRKRLAPLFSIASRVRPTITCSHGTDTIKATAPGELHTGYQPFTWLAVRVNYPR